MSTRPSPTSELAERFPVLIDLIHGYMIAAADDDDGSAESAIIDLARDSVSRAASLAEAARFLLGELPDEARRVQELTRLGWPFLMRSGELDRLLCWVVIRFGAGAADWDASPVGTASYPDLATAEACATAMVRAHLPELERFLAGKGQRCRPLRLDFDDDVGTVVARDGFQGAVRRAVLLVHNDEGYPLVYSTYPELPRPPAPDKPALEVLFGAYFYADWFDDDEQPIDVLLRFAQDEPANLVAAATAELRELAETEDAAMHAQVYALGSYFLPRPDGQLRTFIADALTLLEH